MEAGRDLLLVWTCTHCALAVAPQNIWAPNPALGTQSAGFSSSVSSGDVKELCAGESWHQTLQDLCDKELLLLPTASSMHAIGNMLVSLSNH